MLASKSELFAVLRQYNPWWDGKRIPDLPPWRRAAFREVSLWLNEPPTHRAVLLSGARQIGKTTLLLQAIESLIAAGIKPSRILYATLDHPLLKLTGAEKVLELWHEFEPAGDEMEFLFFDEIQNDKNWQTWLKLQVDFAKHRRIFVTGSATPLVVEGQESGVGRWHTIRLATLSFFEYLQIKKISVPELPEVPTLAKLFDWQPNDFARTVAKAAPLVGHFHEYLLRGGFPQAALMESIPAAQKLLREDIVDKVLKRDMTALFGVRLVLELEQVFLYLCMHDGALLDIGSLCSSLQLNKPTVNNFISLLEAAHLIHRLQPFGYGKEILRAKSKVYLADAAIAPSVLLKGKSLLEDDAALGLAVETAFFKHVFTRYYGQSISFSYWRSKKTDREVDIIANVEGRLVPFEVKYRSKATGAGDMKGLAEFCAEKKVMRGYAITKAIDDFSIMPLETEGLGALALKIPAPLACYWLGKSEISHETV